MQNSIYTKFNNIVGWVIWLVATTVYWVTVEPTVSFWDCGEFIAVAYKQLVGHPPGAPLFAMIGRLFSLFAPDNERIALAVNTISVLASSFTILFLFWTITHLAKRVMKDAAGKITDGQAIAIYGSGIIGSLAYAFSDTFWFSSEEGEVYALSSFITALCFWAILKWESKADEPSADKWLVFIAYLIGLAVGVHLLNLLAIPALAYVYYFRKYEPTRMGMIKTGAVAIGIVAFIQYGIIPGIPKWGFQFDLFFVNTLGLPFWSGFFFFLTSLITLVIWGLYYSRVNKKYVLNKVLWCFAFILLGYSSFTQIVIRSNADPPMDENNPEHMYSLLSYLNREQYGARPLFRGQYFTAKVIGTDEGSTRYIKGEDKYEEAGKKPIHVYDPKHKTIFPRCYNSLDKNHVKFYKNWLNLKDGKKPSFADNMNWFFSYQIGWMYFRYFMWNFAGRQNDTQGHGNIKHGNWLSGINWIDNARLGPQEKIPENWKNEKSRNELYFLPLILGLIGLYYHYSKHNQDAFIVTLLFFFTGLAIVIYLNQTPLQPRERDYAYAASFYAFCIWIGFGALGIYEALKNKMSEKSAATLATIICLIVPGIMCAEEWDDHDRSNTYTARDSASNYLNSCKKNAVIFTNGDNDTFPLWYIQEVEGVRTDVRVCNLSLLSTDWYIDQMKRRAYDSAPVPFSLTKDKYVQGTRDYVPYYDRKLKGYTDLKEVVEFIASDNAKTRARTQGGDLVDYLPTKTVRIPVDADKVIANGTVKEEDRDKIVPYIEWKINKGGLYKSDLMILDLLAHNDWGRPIYFAITVSNSSYLNLQAYFQQEGLAYRLVPIKSKTRGGQVENIATDIMYENVMNKFKWGGMSDDIYMNENNIRMTSNFRHNFIRLAEALVRKGEKEKAVGVLDRCLEVMPDHTVPYNVFIVRVADLYYSADKPEKANKVMERLVEIYVDNLEYYTSLRGKYKEVYQQDMRQDASILQELHRLAKSNKQVDLAEMINSELQGLAIQVAG
ncbi:DUF2723 domain-containing protein [bacterium AH-315-C07]|nr:DUF2723 domain-containing protein [bacterium AH-315-C07]